MNSLLQQFFMIPEFREPLLTCEDKTDPTVPEEDNVLANLKYLFQQLKHSEKQSVNPKNFCHAFKDLEGNPTNIFEQMDVDEFCNLLLDRLEAAGAQDLVKKVFGGVIAHEIVGQDGGCQHTSEREEPFYALTLTVKNKKSVEQSLQTLVQGEMLAGENAYQCEECQKKVSAVKRIAIKRLPERLILVLKRFEFDFDLMMKMKVNDHYEFPEDLDLLPYSQQHLSPDQHQELPQSYFKYRLRGVVVHTGSADFGHYYSFIHSQKKWYEFNDTLVSFTDFQSVMQDSLGGVQSQQQQQSYPQQQYFYDTKFKNDSSKNGYLLFYERVSKDQDFHSMFSPKKPLGNLPILQQSKSQQEEGTSEALHNAQVTRNENQQKLLDSILKENSFFASQKLIFNKGFFRFLQETIENVKFPKSDLLKFYITFTLNCASREMSREWLHNNIEKIVQLLTKSATVGEWLLRAFMSPNVIKEFLFDCPHKIVRRYVVILLAAACRSLLQQKGHKNLFNCDSQGVPVSLLSLNKKVHSLIT